MGPARKMYHKHCLACTSCGTKLAPGAVQEHEEEPYCRNCYLRLFSTQDLRHGNLPTTGVRSPPRSNPPSPEHPHTPKSITSQTTGSGVREHSQPPVSPLPTGHSSSPLARIKLGGSQSECPKCHKAVYHAEQVNAVGRKWHRACLQCVCCTKRLDTHNISEKDSDPYCRSCYSKTHGPAGSGYALLGKAGA